MAGVNDTPGQHSSNDQPAAAAANRLKRPEQPLCSAKPRQRTVRSWLAGLVLACVLPVWVGAAFLVYRGYQQQRRLMEQHVLETTRALSLVVDGEFAAMEASLTSLATSPFLDTGDLAAFHRQAQAARKGYPGGEIVLATAAGDQLLNTLAPKPFRPPFPNRRNLEVARSVFEGKPFISNLYMGLLQHRLVVSVEVPVIRNGRVLYDLAMTVPARHLEAVFSRQSIPPDWPSGIVDRNHVLVARNMHGGKYVGLPTRVKWAAEAGEGVVEITDREGVPVFAVFSRSPRTGWAVTVGIPKAVMLAGTRQWLWWTVSGAILLSALGIALALFLARRIAGSIQALIAPALALGAGKPVDDDDIGPLGLAETSAVGQSLVKASLLLRQHTAERELAEATIRASHQQLQAIIDGATDTVVFLKDVDGRFITANSRFEKLLGITRGDVQGKTDYDILTKERADYYRAHDRLILTTGQPMQVEEVALLADGKEHIFLANKFPLVDASGKAYAVCAISADITERKQAEEALRESQSNAVFATLADFVPQMVWMCTPDGLNIYFNQRWVEYTGLTLEESYGRGWNTPFHADDKQAAWDAWNHAVQTGEQYHVESRLRAADGSYRWFLMRGAPLRNPAQEIVRWFGTCTDIEELKQAEQAQLEPFQ